jgi:hypothetical protein
MPDGRVVSRQKSADALAAAGANDQTSVDGGPGVRLRSANGKR